MKQKSLKINIFLNILRTLMSLIFPIITFPYASRILLPEGIGKINYVNSIISYFTMLAMLGINTYGTREVARLRDNKDELNRFCSEVFTLNILSTIVSYILLFSIIFFVPKFNNYLSFLIYASITILFTTIGICWLYGGIEEYAYITFRTVLFQIISIILLFLFIKTSDDLLKYLLIGIIGSVGSNLLNLFYSKKFIKLRIVKPNLKKHLKPILLLFSITIISSIYNTLDTTMLGLLSNDEQVGFYAAATKINRMVLALVTSISVVVFPRISYYAEKNSNEFIGVINKFLSLILCISIPCSVGLHLLCEPIMLLFSGEKYIPAIPVMKIMNPIIIIVSLSNLIGTQIFIPLKKEKTTIRAVSIGASVNFILNIILIKRYQAYGAAIATLVAESIVLIHQIICSYNYISLKNEIKNIIQYIISTLAMAFLVIILKNNIQNIILLIILSISSGALLYFIILVILRNSMALNIINLILNKLIRKQ